MSRHCTTCALPMWQCQYPKCLYGAHMTVPSGMPPTENIQKPADDLSVKCGASTIQAAIRIYLRQLALYVKEWEGGVLLGKSLKQMEIYLTKINLLKTALAESRAEADKQRQIAANWENMAAMHKMERDESRAECEQLRAERDRYKADAERYRWLRDKSEPNNPDCTFYLSVGDAFKDVKFSKFTVDTSIDAALKERTE